MVGKKRNSPTTPRAPRSTKTNQSTLFTGVALNSLETDKSVRFGFRIEEGEGKTGVPVEKPLGAEASKQQTQPTCEIGFDPEIEPEIKWWETPSPPR